MDFVIIANGEFLVKEILLEAIENKKIVALDGALNKLHGLGIKPHIILGDFDSLLPELKDLYGVTQLFADLKGDEPAYFNAQGIQIVPVLNQLETDLTKAIHFCDHANATSITILCALGKRIDHQEGALRNLMREYKPTRPILLHGTQQTIRFLQNERLFFRGEIGDKCGVLAYPEGQVSSSGLVYEADHFPLIFGTSENICNELAKNEVSVDILGSALLIMPPQLRSQRHFSNLPMTEQLTLSLRDAACYKNYS